MSGFHSTTRMFDGVMYIVVVVVGALFMVKGSISPADLVAYLQLEIMKINIIDSVLCVVLVWILVPKMAVEGYILTIYFAEIINFCLSFMKLGKASKLRLSPWKNVFVPIFCSFAAMKLSKKLLFLLKKPTPGLILSIGVGVILYYFFLRIGKGISKEDSMWLKNVIKP